MSRDRIESMILGWQFLRIYAAILLETLILYGAILTIISL